MNLDAINIAADASMTNSTTDAHMPASPSQTFNINVDDPANFSTLKLGRILHNYHLHPLL